MKWRIKPDKNVVDSHIRWIRILKMFIKFPIPRIFNLIKNVTVPTLGAE